MIGLWSKVVSLQRIISRIPFKGQDEKSHNPETRNGGPDLAISDDGQARILGPQPPSNERYLIPQGSGSLEYIREEVL
jgi:hypothetical protein